MLRAADASHAARDEELNTVTHMGNGVAYQARDESVHTRHLGRLDDAQRAYRQTTVDALADSLGLS